MVESIQIFLDIPYICPTDFSYNIKIQWEDFEKSLPFWGYLFPFYKLLKLGASGKHSSLCKESPAELMLLAFVWDKAASGIARSNTENGLHSWSAPHFCTGQDCLCDSEEQHRDWTELLICSSFMYWTARINTEKRLHSWSAPPFIMGQDCFWNREKYNVSDINPFVPR